MIEREISKASSLFLSNSSFFLATMSRQRVFTALEVAEMLQNDEDDDWLFAGRSGPVDTSEEEDDDDTGDVRRSHPPSMEVDSSSDAEGRRRTQKYLQLVWRRSSSICILTRVEPALISSPQEHSLVIKCK